MRRTHREGGRQRGGSVCRRLHVGNVCVGVAWVSLAHPSPTSLSLSLAAPPSNREEGGGRRVRMPDPVPILGDVRSSSSRSCCGRALHLGIRPGRRCGHHGRHGPHRGCVRMMIHWSVPPPGDPSVTHTHPNHPHPHPLCARRAVLHGLRAPHHPTRRGGTPAARARLLLLPRPLCREFVVGCFRPRRRLVSDGR